MPPLPIGLYIVIGLAIIAKMIMDVGNHVCQALGCCYGFTLEEWAMFDHISTNLFFPVSIIVIGILSNYARTNRRPPATPQPKPS